MAGAAGVHQSSALHGYGAPFLVVSLPMEPVECEELTKGVSGAGCAAERFKLQPLAVVGECSKGQLKIRLGQTGAARNVEHRCWVDGA
jgi:hypothetical protein